MLVAIARRASRVALVLGRLERLPRRGARHPAHHRDAGADARRPRGRPAHHRRLHHDGQQRAATSSSRAATSSGCPFAFFIAVAAIAVVAAGRAADGARRADRGRRHQPRGQPAGRRALARHRLRRLRRQRHCSPASPASSTAPTSWPPTPTPPATLHRALRDPRGRARRHLAAWAASSRIAGTVDRRPHHPDARVHDPLPRRALGAEPGRLRRRRHHRRADPVAAGAPHGASRHPAAPHGAPTGPTRSRRGGRRHDHAPSAATRRAAPRVAARYAPS